MLGWSFYEMSGGADFVPETSPTTQTSMAVASPEIIPFDAPQVTRAAMIETPTAAQEAAIIPASLPATPESPVVEAAPLDLRVVSGKRVNMRSGPGTNYDVLDTLVRGTQTEVIEISTDGWARVRVIESNQIGWMAERLLSQI